MLHLVSWDFRIQGYDQCRKLIFIFQRAADPAVANTIFQRRKDFQQSPVTKSIMSFLGSNVLVVSIQAKRLDQHLD